MKRIGINFTLWTIILFNTSFYFNASRSAGTQNVFLASAGSLMATDSIPKDYFSSPLDLPLTLAGNFGEPRRLHFHTGLDFRTNQEEGHEVFAAADGFVSRINVSAVGYGNALYITHANGYVTVYGHLQKFNSRIMQRLRKEQYANESFTVDFKLNPNEIPVKKGDPIGLSGNTGGSGGPHLHFEIRDSAERIYNPMLFGYMLKDDMKPVISYLKFYPMDELKYTSPGYRTKVFGKQGTYQISGGLLKVNASKIGISVNTFDVINLTDAHIGIYCLTLYEDHKLIYEYRMDKFSFNDKRDVLSHIDYPVFINESHRTFHKCFVDPGNHCPVYSNLVNAGIIDLSDEKAHPVQLEVSDYAGNVSSIKFQLQRDRTSTLFKANELKYATRFDYDHDNEFSNTEIKMNIPSGCLFDNVLFRYAASRSTEANIFSKIFQLGNSDVQVFNWFDLSLKTEGLNAAFCNKAVIVFKDGPGIITSRGGKFEATGPSGTNGSAEGGEGFIHTQAREFGTYYVRLDTTMPLIKPLNIFSNRNMRAYKKILIRISDNLSGITDYDTYIDGKWALTDYDAKSGMLTHTLDQKLSSGAHQFKVVVTDERKNEASYSVNFVM